MYFHYYGGRGFVGSYFCDFKRKIWNRHFKYFAKKSELLKYFLWFFTSQVKSLQTNVISKPKTQVNFTCNNLCICQYIVWIIIIFTRLKSFFLVMFWIFCLGIKFCEDFYLWVLNFVIIFTITKNAKLKTHQNQVPIRKICLGISYHWHSLYYSV